MHLALSLKFVPCYPPSFPKTPGGERDWLTEMHAPTDSADEWYLSQLEANPGDWHLRCLVTQRLYECGDYSKAAQLMSDAPDIPGDEESIIFAATILGVETPLTGIAILKGYQAASGSSPAIDELQQHLNDLKNGQTTEFPATPETNAVKVMPKPQRLGQTDVVEEDQRLPGEAQVRDHQEDRHEHVGHDAPLTIESPRRQLGP